METEGQPSLKTDPLQITVHHDRPVGPDDPTDWAAIRPGGEEVDRAGWTRDVMETPIDTDLKSLIAKRLFEEIEPCEDGRQDGQMGHEPDARFDRP